MVAAVNGVAAGAGANIALAADFVIASAEASFIQAFVKIGLIPDNGGTFFLPRLVGLARATSLAMLGGKVTAQQAKDWGMIHDVASRRGTHGGGGRIRAATRGRSPRARWG